MKTNGWTEACLHDRLHLGIYDRRTDCRFKISIIRFTRKGVIFLNSVLKAREIVWNSNKKFHCGQVKKKMKSSIRYLLSPFFFFYLYTLHTLKVMCKRKVSQVFDTCYLKYYWRNASQPSYKRYTASLLQWNDFNGLANWLAFSVWYPTRFEQIFCKNWWG